MRDGDTTCLEVVGAVWLGGVDANGIRFHKRPPASEDVREMADCVAFPSAYLVPIGAERNPDGQ